MSTAGNKVRILYTEFAGSDLGVRVEYFFREGRVLKGPEHQQTLALIRVFIFMLELISDS